MSALLSVLYHVGLIPLAALIWLVGYVQGYRRRARRTPKPICGCSHHVAFHDENGCHASDKRRTDSYGGYTTGWVCGCQRYVGPGPDPEFLP